MVDAGSEDGTRNVARAFGATVLQHAGPTIGAQRNTAIAMATQPWVLALDADERATPELRRSIELLLAAPACQAYRVHMRNRYLGALMERGGWGRDKHVRFFRSSLRYRVNRVHERLDYEGPVADLDGRVDHDSYRDLAHQLTKVNTYARWGASDLQERNVRVGLSHLVFRPLFRFVKCYLFQGAFLEGRRGLVLSVVHAWSAFAKYALLWDAERQQASPVSDEIRAAVSAAAPDKRGRAVRFEHEQTFMHSGALRTSDGFDLAEPSSAVS